jgi:uncharacterized protein YchJ
MPAPNSEQLRSLFDELRSIRFGETEKPSRAENLTDILEIVAVFAGLKPSHLSGHGFRSESLMLTLEQIAPRYGLLTMRTSKCKHFRRRRPNYESAIVRWQDQTDERKASRDGDVLWIYKNPSLTDEILSVVAGHASVSRVLGYPDCCVTHHLENAIRVGESYVAALCKAHSAPTAEEVIRLMEADVSVEVASAEIDMTNEESNLRFPYVQFYVCRRCLTKPDSPAVRINKQMRDLAFLLSKEFAQDVWRAHYLERRAQTEISRNGPCPCGSGKKYKRCCDSGN